MTRKLTAEEKIQAFERQLQFQARRKAQATDDFTEGVVKHGVLYTIEWGRGDVETIAQAELWESVQHAYDATEGEDKVAGATAALLMVLAEVEKQLLRNWVQKNSTDPLANAVSAAKAEAHARFHDEATGLLKHLTANEE